MCEENYSLQWVTYTCGHTCMNNACMITVPNRKVETTPLPHIYMLDLMCVCVCDVYVK